MPKFVLVGTVLDCRRFEGTKVLGVYDSLESAKARADELVKDLRDIMGWEDGAPAWSHDAERNQWSTTDFPEDCDHHRYTVDQVD